MDGYCLSCIVCCGNSWIWSKWMDGTSEVLLLRICTLARTSRHHKCLHWIELWLLVASNEKKREKKERRWKEEKCPSKFCFAIQSYCSRWSADLLLYDSKLTLIRLDGRKKSRRTRRRSVGSCTYVRTPGHGREREREHASERESARARGKDR